MCRVTNVLTMNVRASRDRAKSSNEDMQKAQKAKDRDAYTEAACRTWIDVRSFGQVFAFKDSNVSVGVRGLS